MWVTGLDSRCTYTYKMMMQEEKTEEKTECSSISQSESQKARFSCENRVWTRLSSVLFHTKPNWFPSGMLFLVSMDCSSWTSLFAVFIFYICRWKEFLNEKKVKEIRTTCNSLATWTADYRGHRPHRKSARKARSEKTDKTAGFFCYSKRRGLRMAEEALFSSPQALLSFANKCNTKTRKKKTKRKGRHRNNT